MFNIELINAFLCYNAKKNIVAVEIYDKFDLKWSHRYDIDTTRNDEYFIEVSNQIIDDMQNCEYYKDYVKSDIDSLGFPTYYDDSNDTIIILKFTNKCFTICKDNDLCIRIATILAKRWIYEAKLQGHYDIYDGYILCTSDTMISHQREWSDCYYEKDKDFTVAPFWLWTDHTIAINNEDDIVHILTYNK